MPIKTEVKQEAEVSGASGVTATPTGPHNVASGVPRPLGKEEDYDSSATVSAKSLFNYVVQKVTHKFLSLR
jgi:hypothetical protein